MLFVKPKPINELPELTSEQAQTIYDGLKTKDANTLFLEDNIPTEYTKQVLDEMSRLEAEVNSKMRGSFIITPAVYEDGELVTPVVKFVLTTETALKESMSSNLLDTDQLVVDVRAYSGDNLTWSQYKALFNSEE